MKYLRGVASRVLLLALLACVRPVFAQEAPNPVPSNGALARQAGDEGIAHYESGRWPEALERFRQAEALYHSPVFVLYEARSLHRIGRLLEARSVYARLLAENVDQDDPAPWKLAQADGRAELAALEAQIPSIVISVEGGSPQTKTTLNARAVRPGERIELDPGAYAATAMDGQRQVVSQISLAAGVHERQVVLRFSAPVTPQTAPLPPPAVAHERRGPYLPGLILTGAGGAALVAGAVTGALSLSKANDAEHNLPANCRATTCLESERAAVEQGLEPAYGLATATDVLLVSGAVLATTGVVLMLIDPRAEARPVGRGGTVSVRF